MNRRGFLTSLIAAAAAPIVPRPYDMMPVTVSDQCDVRVPITANVVDAGAIYFMSSDGTYVIQRGRAMKLSADTGVRFIRY